MTDIHRLVAKAMSVEATLAERHQAFGQLVARFEDMAYGYAYSLLGNPASAEEAAQEAFLIAWQRLPQLQQPQAFPAWFKRIVFTHCFSLARRKQAPALSLEDLGISDEHAASSVALQAALEEAEPRTIVQEAIQQLPEGERIVTILFYINQYSWDEIAGFLDISAIAVKKRLASARKRLKKGLMSMVQEDLHAQRPSRDSGFTQRVLTFCGQFGHLLESGTPILPALEQCAAAQQDSARFRQAILEMSQAVQQGKSIAEIMTRFSDVFPEPFSAVIQIGEETGTLDQVLQRLTHGESFADAGQVQALRQEMQAVATARNQIPNVMAHFPHLFREHDLRAIAIGEETGLSGLVVHRLSCGQTFDTDVKLQALREEMQALRTQFHSRPSS